MSEGSMVSKGRAFVGVEVCLDRKWERDETVVWRGLFETIASILKIGAGDYLLAEANEYYPLIYTIAFLGASRQRWLENYSCKFDTAEIWFMDARNIFGHTPPEKPFVNLRRRTPAGFSFALMQTIPEFREIGDIDRWFKIFFDRAFKLEDKLKVMVWTFYSAKLDMGMLSELTTRLAQFSGIRHAFQFPEKSWFCARAFDALAERGMTLYLTDPGDV